MKNVFLFLMLVFSTQSFGRVYKYNLYEDSINEMTPWQVRIVTHLIKPEMIQTIDVLDAEKDAMLFIFTGDDLLVELGFLESKRKIMPLVIDYSTRGWGDTDITALHKYGISIEDFSYNKETGFHEGHLTIDDYDVGESALWGRLVPAE